VPLIRPKGGIDFDQTNRGNSLVTLSYPYLVLLSNGLPEVELSKQTGEVAQANSVTRTNHCSLNPFWKKHCEAEPIVTGRTIVT
jgi:hypothetical protein